MPGVSPTRILFAALTRNAVQYEDYLSPTT